MKRMTKKSLVGILSLAMVVTPLSLQETKAAAKSITLSKQSVTMTVGQTKKVTIKNGTKKAIQKAVWKVTSGQKKVKLVKKNKSYVSIKGLKKGTAKISVKVTVNNKTYTCNLTAKVKAKTMENTNDTVANPINIDILEIPNGDNTVYGRIYSPEDKEKHPAIILCHGYNGTNNDFVNECRLYAENGYVAYAFDFCGGSARSMSKGLKTTEMTIFTEKSDLIAVYNYIAGLDIVDPSQIFLFGGSQGGLVTTLATEELGPEKVKGMALYFPALCIPDNWRTTYPDVSKIPEVNDFWGMKLGKNFFTSIHDFKVFDNIGKYSNDVLILHGDKDAIVPLSYSQKAVEIYPSAKLITMPGEGHGFTPAGGKTAREEVLAYLNAHTTK